MRYFRDKAEFEKQMVNMKKFLERKGYVIESEHPYAYCMQYGEALKDVSEWLVANGYRGDLQTMAYCEGIAVYGLYDSCKISYDEMQAMLKKEFESQMNIIK